MTWLGGMFEAVSRSAVRQSCDLWGFGALKLLEIPGAVP